MSSNSIPIIIPSFEPDNRLFELVKDLSRNNLTPIIIVNDGSGTEYNQIFDLCKNYPEVTILTHQTNQGKGHALKTAFAYILDNYEVIGCVTADSDGQHTYEAISDCQKELLENPNNLVLGVRDFNESGVPEKSRFGNNLTKKVFKFLYNVELSDTQTGLRGISRSYMHSLLSLKGERFEFETRMLIDCIERNITISEVCIPTIYDSKTNHSTHFNPVFDSIKIYKLFFSSFFKFIFSKLRVITCSKE